MKKIPAIVLCYFNFDIIKKTIEFLINTDRFEIYVLENMSKYTETLMKPYFLDLVRNKKIYCYTLFDRNISNNAYKLFFDNVKIKNDSEYVLITDGDIVLENDEGGRWLNEQIKIISSHVDIESCGINLSIHNLPLSNPFFNQPGHFIYDCRLWNPEEIGVMHNDYLEAGTGIHLLLVKRQVFKDFISWIREKRFHFLDEHFRYFIKEIKNLKWALTKNSKGTHLVWNIYNDTEHEYTKFKMHKNFYTFWKHYDYCPYTIYTCDSTTRKYPLKGLWAFLKTKIFKKTLNTYR